MKPKISKKPKETVAPFYFEQTIPNTSTCTPGVGKTCYVLTQQASDQVSATTLNSLHDAGKSMILRKYTNDLVLESTGRFVVYAVKCKHETNAVTGGAVNVSVGPGYSIRYQMGVLTSGKFKILDVKQVNALVSQEVGCSAVFRAKIRMNLTALYKNFIREYSRRRPSDEYFDYDCLVMIVPETPTTTINFGAIRTFAYDEQQNLE